MANKQGFRIPCGFLNGPIPIGPHFPPQTEETTMRGFHAVLFGLLCLSSIAAAGQVLKGPQPVHVPSDAKAKYWISSKRIAAPANHRLIVTKRSGWSGTSYSVRVADCSVFPPQSVYIGTGDTLKAAMNQSVRSLKAAGPNAKVDVHENVPGSISDVITRKGCTILTTP